MFDAHIHQYMKKGDSPETFLQKAHSVGITGGNIFSPGPEWTIGEAEGDFRWENRLDMILGFTEKTPGFYPFFWINPTAPDIEKQIHTAVERGIKGFKIICDKYYPEDCLKACKIIAETGLPVMFHSGVLGGSRDQLSCKYNMPSGFEILFSIKGLRFSLAHLGWPWVDDYMAMVAKSAFTFDPDFGNVMYFDLTPGTPGIYRQDALRKLYLTAYSVKTRVLWGTDGTANDYSADLINYWRGRDIRYMAQIALDAELPQQPGQKTPPDLSDIYQLATEENWKTFNGMTK